MLKFEIKSWSDTFSYSYSKKRKFLTKEITSLNDWYCMFILQMGEFCCRMLQFCCIKNKTSQNVLGTRCYNCRTELKIKEKKMNIWAEQNRTRWRALDWRVCKIVKKKKVRYNKNWLKIGCILSLCPDTISILIVGTLKIENPFLFYRMFFTFFNTAEKSSFSDRSCSNYRKFTENSTTFMHVIEYSIQLVPYINWKVEVSFRLLDA